MEAATVERGRAVRTNYLLMAAVLAVLAWVIPASAQDDYNQWAYRTSLWLNTKASGADVSGTETDFPVLVRLNPGNFGVWWFRKYIGS